MLPDPGFPRNALRAGATVEQEREAAKGKIRAILDEELRHVADVRANGAAATNHPREDTELGVLAGVFPKNDGETEGEPCR